MLSHHADILLILEHSFYLHQQGDHQPVSSAAQMYKASKSRDRVNLALKEVFEQYAKASDDQRADMVINVVLQNRMYVFMPFSTPPTHSLILVALPTKSQLCHER